MATQTFVTDMQALNPVQQVQQQATSQAQNNVQQTTQVKAVGQGQTQGPTTTIIQPAQAHSGQQFIVTITGDPATEQVPEAVQLQQGSGQVVYQPQYVEDSSDALYAASNGQIQNYSEYNQAATMYTPVTTYYQSSSSQHNMGNTTSQVSGLQGQILTHQAGAFFVHGGTMDGEGHPLTHTTRASPATDANGQRSAHFDVKCWQREVQWLIDNYETAEGVSLPRSTLYNHYIRHCQEQKIDAMNPASFGKLIRSVFLGLRTRRLGTRGNSKYHYYGIRIKANSPLNQYTDELTMAMRQQPVNQGKRFKPPFGSGESQDSGSGLDGMQPQHQHMQFLGDTSAAIPEFGSIEMGSDPLPDDITHIDLAEFEELYKEHCEGILEIVINLQFSIIVELWQTFWRNADGDPENVDIDEHRLSKEKLYRMCKMPQVHKFVLRSDYAFYQALVEVLIPDVLRPIPSSLTQAIRNFAKSLEGWLKQAAEGIPEEMVKTKIGAVSAFAQTLRRYTSLNHLAQAARAVLQNTTQINQMLTDLNRVDFTNVQEQASWVCQCEDEVVHQLEQDFKKTLQQQNSLEQWAEWLEGVVQQVLQRHEGSENFPKAARQFLLKWSFYSSMVIRDLTLRSAASFGSFHLIRLLYDEYMFYLVEHKVANATGETPIAVMGEFADLGPVMSMGTLETDSKPVIPATTSITCMTATTVVKPQKVNGRATTITAVPKSIMVAPAGAMNHTLTTQGRTLASMNHTLATLSSVQSVMPKAITITPGSINHAISAAQCTTATAMPKTIAVATGSVNHNLINISNQVSTSNSLTATGQVVSQVHALVNNPTAITGVSSSGAHPQTIVVVPMNTTTGSGDAQPIVKKFKTN